MKTITALIPRLRHRTGRVVAIRCADCWTWRKPRYYDRNQNTCRDCVTAQLRAYFNIAKAINR